MASKIDLLPGNRFKLDGDTSAILIPVRDRSGQFFDFVAYEESDPATWYTKAGEAVLLGARQLAGAALSVSRIPIFPTPQSWLAGGGNGVCVLDWGVMLAPIFNATGGIDLGHLAPDVAVELRKRITANFWESLPRIYGGRKAVGRAR